MKVDKEMEGLVEKSSHYFKGLTDPTTGKGLGLNSMTEDRVMAVVKDLLSQEDKSVAAGLNWNPMDYLLEKGFINVQSRESLAKLAGVERTGGQLSGLLNLGKSPLAGASNIPGAFEGMKATEPWAMKEEGRIAGRLAEAAAAIEGGVGPFRDIMREKAFAAMGGKTAFGADKDTIFNRTMFNPREMFFGDSEGIDLEGRGGRLSRPGLTEASTSRWSSPGPRT